jgi:hypothetical protein
MRNQLRLVAAFAIPAMASPHILAQSCVVERASNSYLGAEANSYSSFPFLSYDGQFVLFSSQATNLVPGDANQATDAFVLDRTSDVIERASVSTAGGEGNNHSGASGISGDGRMIAFISTATNLDPRDTDSVPDVYVHDRWTGMTNLVSERLGSGVSIQGCPDASISLDGRFVAFSSLDNNILPGIPGYNVFVRDLAAQTTEVVSIGPLGQVSDFGSFYVSISGDGRFVAFSSAATNWFPVAANYQAGAFVRDRLLGKTLPATMLPSGVLSPGNSLTLTISSDGRYLAYEGGSRFLVPSQPILNLGFGGFDILRWDRMTGKTVNTCLSAQGGMSCYPSRAPSLSADGRFIAFETLAWNQTVKTITTPVPIWRDLETGAAVAVNQTPGGDPANDWADDVAISGDGRVVAFVSKATDILPGASGNVYHVYVRACDVASPSTYCNAIKPAGGCAGRMSFQGSPSASAGSGFDVRATGLTANSVGLLFYGTNGPWGTRVSAQGYLCVKAPVVHAQLASTQGSAGCDGFLSMDFNAWIAAGGDPALVAGQSVYAQTWFRNATGSGQFSDALAFLIGP